MHGQAYAEAVRSLTRGLALTEGIPGGSELNERLRARLQLARRGQAANQLHHFANRIRFLYADDSRNAHEGRNLEEHCQKIWDTRTLFEKRQGAELEPTVEQQIQADLLDLAILWADLRVRWASTEQIPLACRDALRLLTEAQELLGPNVILERERQVYAKKIGGGTDGSAPSTTQMVPRTAWEHFWLGRSFLGSGNLTQAVAEFDRALSLNPGEFWASFYRGQCSYRLQHYAEAVNAFSVCLALTPKSAQCFYNRALAQNALGDTEKALLDYERALELDTTLAAAALNRGLLHYNAKRYSAAIADLERALRIGADAGTVHYNLALIHLANGDRAKALASVRTALEQPGEQPDARNLLNRLTRKP
jgi:tetratricopeptide (TPR) repeat protein